MKLDSLHDLFVMELQDLYDAEQQIDQAMRHMLLAVEAPELREAMENHFIETQSQIKRLEKLCNDLGIEPVGKQCMGMEGIIEEGIELLQDNPAPSPVLDAAIIAALQKVEHYEISGYGTAVAYAKQLGHSNALDVLHEIMLEEKQSDDILQNLAEGLINQQADLSQSGRYAM